MKKVLFLLFLYNSTLFYAQNTLRGYVIDSLTNEALIGSYIIINKKVVDTDVNGYFELRVSLNEHKLLEVRQLGYQTKYISIENQNLNKIQTIKLAPYISTEVIISSQKDLSTSQKIGVFKISSTEIKRLSSLAGEPDVLQALHFKAGFQPTTEGLSGVVARGGLPDQNLLLVNGVRVYNYAHVFGFLSFVNGEMIKDVSVHKSGFHGKYGSRASSVIDMTLFDGNTKKTELDATIGTLTSKFSLKAPIIKDKWGFSLGGRTANLGVINFFSNQNYNQSENANKVNVHVHDFTLNTKYILTKSSNLTAFVIKSSDKIEAKSKINFINEDIRLSAWSNWVSGIKFHKILPQSWKLDMNAGYLFYENYFDQISTINNLVDAKSGLYSNLMEYSFSTNISKYFNNNYSTTLGLSYYLTDLNSLRYTDLIDTLTTPSNRQNNINIYSSTEVAFEKIKASITLRYDVFDRNIRKGVFQPRIKALYFHNDKFTFHTAYDVMTQNAFQVPVFNNEPPLDIWIQVNSNFGVNKNQQISIGGRYRLTQKWVLNMDLFYKNQNNIIDNTVIYKGITKGATELENTLSYNGKLEAYGAEMEFNMSYDKFNIEYSYTYTNSLTTFQEIQNGEPFTTNFLRPHSFNFHMSYTPTKRWNFSLKSIWMSGQPFTAAINAYYDDSNSVSYIFGNRNNGRYPNYFRADIGIEYKKNKKTTWSFYVYNLTARRNPFFIYLKQRQFIREPDVSFSGYYDDVLFTILPSISYSRKIF